MEPEAQKEENRFVAEFVQRFQKGTTTPKDIDRALELGLFDKSGDLSQNVKDHLSLTPHQRIFKRLELEDAQKIIEKSPPDAQLDYLPIYLQKLENEPKQRKLKIPSP